MFQASCVEARLARLEELTYFQEERLKALDAALTAQQGQLDRLEKALAETAALARHLREQLGDGIANVPPPHSLPQRW